MQHDSLTSFPNIETKRLLLRQAIEEDAGDILAIFWHWPAKWVRRKSPWN